MSDLPPVIVLGVDTPIGLTVVRELAQRGAAVHGVAWSHDSLVLSSRHLASGSVRARQESGLIEQLVALSRNTGARWLMTVSETDITLLHRIAGALSPLEAIVPDPEAFATVLDKHRTIAAARDIGIGVPRTWTVTSADQIEAVAAEVTYPVVLKWSNPHTVSSSLESHGVALEKCGYAFERAGLISELARYVKLELYPLVQEYAPGHGLGQMFFLHDGVARLRFQHRRVAEWPPEGGVSAVCESVSLDEHALLQEQSIALLQAIGWQGPAMVEYRFDPESRRAVLMEINGRFWGSLPLASQCGVHFAAASLAAACGDEIPQQPVYRAGYRCRFFVPEFKRLLRTLLQPSRIDRRLAPGSAGRELLRFLHGYLRPGTGYYVFSLDDPGPFFADIRGMVTRRLPRALRGTASPPQD